MACHTPPFRGGGCPSHPRRRCHAVRVGWLSWCAAIGFGVTSMWAAGAAPGMGTCRACVAASDVGGDVAAAPSLALPGPPPPSASVSSADMSRLPRNGDLVRSPGDRTFNGMRVMSEEGTRIASIVSDSPPERAVVDVIDGELSRATGGWSPMLDDVVRSSDHLYHQGHVARLLAMRRNLTDGSANELSNVAARRALIRDISQAYGRSILREPPPEEPAHGGSVLLAVIVVWPELVTLIALLITTRIWRQRDLWVFFFVFLAGCASLADIISLAVWEAQGARWQAAVLRNELWTEGPDDAFILVVRSVTRCFIAKMEYRPQLLRGIAVSLAVAYVAVSGMVLGVVWALRRLEQGEHDGGHSGGNDRSGSDSGGSKDGGSRGSGPPKAVTGVARWSRRASVDTAATDTVVAVGEPPPSRIRAAWPQRQGPDAPAGRVPTVDAPV